jgi:fructokinase
VTVSLRNGQPNYTIHEGVAWDFIGLDEDGLDALAAERPRAFFFGTLAQRSEVSRRTLDRCWTASRSRKCSTTSTCARRSGLRAGRGGVGARDAREGERRRGSILGGLLFGGAMRAGGFRARAARPATRPAVVVTKGADGCVVCARDREAVRCLGVKVDVVDTVGAGDAFSAAFLAACWRALRRPRRRLRATRWRLGGLARGAVPAEEREQAVGNRQ